MCLHIFVYVVTAYVTFSVFRLPNLLFPLTLNTLDIFFLWLLSSFQSGQSLEGSALILRVLCLFWCFQRFRRRLQSGWQKFLVITAWSGLSPIWHTWWYALLLLGLIFLGVSNLLSSMGLWPSDWSFGGASHGLLIPRFSLILGVFQSSQQDCFAIARNVPGSSFLTSIVFVSRQKRVSSILKFYPTGFLV